MITTIAMMTKIRAAAISLLIVFLIIPLVGNAQYQNVRISPTTATDPEEVSIAINPANPMQLAAGANIDYYYISTNGGLNWTQGRISSSTNGVWGDPCMLFDGAGSLFYGHLSNPPSPGYWIDRIVVQKSTNLGASWNQGASIGYNPPRRNQDKEWLAVDLTNSPYHNNMYISWTQFDYYGSTSSSDSSRILFSRSTDTGITWSTPVRLSERAGDCIDEDNTVEGAVPAVGPNGEVYTSWSGPIGIMFDKSTDGGVTWGTDVHVSDQPGGWDFMIPGIYRANGMPITACDVSNSPYRGNIYICWSDQRNGISNTDVFLAKSTDGGATWSSPRTVNNDITISQQFFTWMTIDQMTGYIYSVFYDRRSMQGNATDVYVARSTDGGDTFTNFKVSQTSFTPTSGVFFGDYTCIAANNGKIYPIWMRLDGSTLSVWTALVTDSVSTIVTEPHGHAESYTLSQNYPNPFNPSTMIRFTTPERDHVSLKLYDVLGREVATLVEGMLDAGEHTLALSAWDYHLASGTYFYRLTAGAYSATRSMIVLQ
jgi:hypothetical protein